MTQSLVTDLGDVAAFFFYHPEQEYHIWKHVAPQQDRLYNATVERILDEREWWVLDAVD